MSANDILMEGMEKRIRELEEELEFYKDQSAKVKVSIWNMLNYTNMFVVVLDEQMDIKFVNWSLAIALGYDNEEDPIGKCWLDFIPEEERTKISIIHKIVSGQEETDNFDDVKEVTNDIVANDRRFSVKWFNAQINDKYTWTFSIGIATTPILESTEDSIRAYYKDILANDRTMIQSLRDAILDKDYTADLEP